jgi:hypothetical protein
MLDNLSAWDYISINKTKKGGRKMKFNGTEKQNKWAEKILTEANLTDEQIDNLLKWAGPTLYSQGIMDAIIVINNRRNLSAYADSLGKFLKLSQAEKHAVAEEACGVVRGLASINISSAAAAIGRIGGSAKSERKAASSRENGKLGGRPKTMIIDGSEKYSVTEKMIPGNGVLRLHLPWPAYYIGEYGSGVFDGSPVSPEASDRVMDKYVSEKVTLPIGAGIVSVIAGRAYRGQNLTPCIVVTVAGNEVGSAIHEQATTENRTLSLGGARQIWFDGLKAH